LFVGCFAVSSANVVRYFARITKTSQPIFTKFGGKDWWWNNGARKKLFDFVDNLDHVTLKLGIG